MKQPVKNFIILVIIINLVVYLSSVLASILVNGIKFPYLFLGEGKPITILSCIQLLIAGLFSIKIFMERKNNNLGPKKTSFLKGENIIWVLIGVGFIFLSIDEMFSIHEAIDHLVNKILLSGTSNRILDIHDDTSILIYAGIGLLTMFFYRKELLNFKSSWILFLIGFVCIFLSVTLDGFTHKKTLFLEILHDKHTWKMLWILFKTLEEGFKSFAGGFFLCGLFYCFHIAKSFSELRP